MHPYYVIRAFGGILFLLGSLIMVYNLWRTAQGRLRDEPAFGELPGVTPAAAGE